jgi:subtilisin family serine protease
MKPHLILKLRPGAPLPEAPHWLDALTSKRDVPDRIWPEVATVLRQAGIDVWITREYRRSGAEWSADERATGLDRVYRLVLQADTSVDDSVIAALARLPFVEEARRGAIGQAVLPEPLPMQLGRPTGADSRKAIYLDEAHAYSIGSPEVTVAVLDTGVALDHPELEGRLHDGFDFVDIIGGAGEFLGDHVGADEVPEDEVGHGTHVAGIIVARGRAMPVGVAPECRILPVRVLAAFKQGASRVGAGLVENINAGVKWAVDQGAQVINMSLGVQHAGGGLPHEEVVAYAQRRDVTIVAASGNDGREALYYPGALPGVIAVGAVDSTGSVSDFSTFGRQVSFVAPGEEIYSTYLARDYAFSTGTSHAAPFVAGAIALLKSYARQRDRHLTDRQAKHVLKHTADKIDQRFKHPKAGFGRLNLADAMRLLDAKLN